VVLIPRPRTSSSNPVPSSSESDANLTFGGHPSTAPEETRRLLSDTRKQRLLTEVLGEIRKLLPFPLLGLDTDNDSVFMNETVRDYCQQVGIEFTRCRPYRKNDQAWVEQKNGAVVRRTIGYRRFEGLQAAAALARLYAAMRLFVNFFQPSFKLAAKARDGALVRKRYHPPATPCQRLLADPRTNEEVRHRVSELRATLDPVRLLQQIRAVQQELVDIADGPALGETAKPTSPTLEQFLSGLRTAWREGEVRPTSVVKAKPKRSRRRPDPFAAVTAELRGWFEAEPWHTSRELLERLQAQCPGVYPDGKLRTLQRRLKEWRREAAHQMVFGTMMPDPALAPGEGEESWSTVLRTRIPAIAKAARKSPVDCRCAWTTLTRRPQLHRANISKAI
jgi:hypothetical protein